MWNNLNAWYGNIVASALTPRTAWKTFYVTANGGTNQQFLQDVFVNDIDWVGRIYSTITLALAQTVAWRWDIVIIAPDYTTAPTDTELWTAWTNWVRLVFGNTPEMWELIAMTSNKALPASTTWAIFTVTWVVEVISIIWVVTTVIQTQACNCKISTVSNSATTDVCADLDITWKLAQSRMSITWTFANAMINTAKWVPVARQATSFIAQEGTIILTTSATNTWNIRWFVRYKPLQEWSRIVWA